MLFELEISAAEEPGVFKVEVLHSEGGGRARGQLVLDADSILRRRTELENAVLASAVQRRRIVSAAEEPLQAVGQQMFEALFTGPVYGAYRASLGAAQQQQKRLRVVLHLTVPELAALPWEALFDPETGAYLCRTEPLVRYVDAPYTAEPLEVRPPLRILGLVAAPRGLPALDVGAEHRNLEAALAKPVAAGRVDLTWAPDASWETIHDLMLDGTWHILHFVGHGDYDSGNDEGILALVGADGQADLVEASRLTDLLCEADPTPRLVVLNSCSSGEAGANDLFSGTAAALVHRGISAVAAMQFSISDTAAIKFARGFYAAIAHGRPVDEAVRSGRIEILGMARTLEWITPVLYVRGGSTQLFTLTGPPSPPPGGTVAEPAPSGTAEAPAPAGPAPGGPGDVSPVRADTAADAGDVATRAGRGTPGHSGPPGRAGGMRRFGRWYLAAAAGIVIAVIGVITALHAFRGTPGASPRWPFDAGAAVYTRPFAVNDVVYVGSTNGHVYSLSAENGAVRWQYPRAGEPQMGAVYSRPGVAGQWVYVGSNHGRIDALNTASGALRWSRRCDQAGDPILSSPVFADGVVYATSGGFACALNAADGARFWNPVAIGAITDTGPTVSLHGAGTPRSRITLYFGSADGHLYALNASTGKVRWKYPRTARLTIGAVDSQPMVSVDGAVYFGSTDGHLYALNASNGAVRWQYPRRGSLASGAVDSQPAVTADGSKVYFAAGFDVYGLNASGRLLSLWSQDPVQLRSAIASSGLVVTQSAVYVGSGQSVSCLSIIKGVPCWSRPFPADSPVVSTPVVNNNGKIYFGTLDGKVYALTPSGRLVHAR